jgi:Domain of unknown function (DUF4338)
MARRIVTLAPSEQAVLDRLTVRLLRPDEQARWDELITTRHYLHNAHLVGEQLRYVAETDGQWQALLGWSAPAYHLKGRDTWIGWSAEQRRARLHLLANNARFLVLTEPGQLPNLASRALALCCARLSADWQARYGHPVVAVESFVDTQLTRGTAYKAAGWQALGATAGFTRVNQDFYLAHDRPKTLFVRWLHQKAAPWLRAPQLPPTLAPHEKKVVPRCPQSVEELQSLWWHLHRTVPESRSALGLRHKQATVLAITLSCLLTGHRGGYRQAALFAQGLTQVQRRHLRCWFNEKTSRFDVPSENCFFRVLSAVAVAALGRALVSWQAAHWGGVPEDELVLVDGKTLKTKGGPHLVGALAQPSGRWLDVERVPAKTNEIPAARTLLARWELDGQIALLDALHTQVETARQIVQDQGGDYVLFVKGNQPGLLAQARLLLPESVSPSGGHAGGQPGPARTAGAGRAARGLGANGLPARPPTGAPGAPRGIGRERNRVGDHQPGTGASRAGALAGVDAGLLGH